jgi:hypothetical protein
MRSEVKLGLVEPINRFAPELVSHQRSEDWGAIWAI